MASYQKGSAGDTWTFGGTGSTLTVGSTTFAGGNAFTDAVTIAPATDVTSLTVGLTGKTYTTGVAVGVTGGTLTSGITTAGTTTTGITLGATATTGMSVTTAVTGVSIGNCPTGIANTDVGATGEHFLDMVDAYTGLVVETGTYASATGKGVTVNATNSRPVSFVFDDAGVALAQDSDVRPVLSRTYFSIDSANTTVRFAGIRGQIKTAAGIDLGGDASEYFAVQGLLECAGKTVIGAGAFAAGVCGMLWADDNFTGTGLAAGVMAKLYQTAGTTTTTSAFAATKWWNSADTWSYGLYIEDATIDAGHDIRLQGGVTIGSGSADPNGTITSPVGSLYIRSGQTVKATLYINTDAGTTWDVLDTVIA